MTAALARAGQPGPDLLTDYARHVRTLGLKDRAVRDRMRIAREFLCRHPGLNEWMALPAADRVAELARTGAWPLICYAIGAGRLRLDLELAGAKNLAGLARAVEARDPEAFAAARASGIALGWKASWVETVLGECLAVVLTLHGGRVVGLTSQIVDAFDTELAACMTIPRRSRRAYRNRLAGVRQLLFETVVTDILPRRRPWARSLDQRLGDVEMAPEIRRALLGYVRTRAAVVRPKSVESLVNDLLPFAEYLTAHRPGITCLRHLERGHIEGYLACAAPGPGAASEPPQARPRNLGFARPVGGAQPGQHARRPRRLGWADAPSRRLVFALWWLIALSGLRRGEAAALDRDDLDAEACELTVSRQLVALPGELYCGPLKSRASCRTIALDEGRYPASRGPGGPAGCRAAPAPVQRPAAQRRPRPHRAGLAPRPRHVHLR